MPLPVQPNPWVTVSSAEVFDNPWVTVIHNDVLRPSGNPGIYSVVHFKRKAVGIIPVDREGFTWLVGQHRYPHDRYEWEIPEGGAEADESPLDCARRELQEEAGLVAAHWTPLLEMQLSNSCTDEVSLTFLAQELTPTAVAPEETEQLAIQRIPLADAFELVLGGHIRDALSVASLLKLQALLTSGRLVLG
ncbi:MAG: NUDIX hydrolase [Verrucomicrobiales bacterium]|nr:NUDIX hydrolase [Verrucomicrobiales bacterium]